MLCDRDHSEKDFLSDTDHHRVTPSEREYGSPRCATLYTQPPGARGLPLVSLCPVPRRGGNDW